MTELYKWKKLAVQGFIIFLVASLHFPSLDLVTGFRSQFGFLVFHKMERQLITPESKQG